MSSAAGGEQGGGRTHVLGSLRAPLSPRRTCPLGHHPTLLAGCSQGPWTYIGAPPPLAPPSRTKSISRPRRGSDYRKRRHLPAQMLQVMKQRKPRNLKGVCGRCLQLSGPRQCLTGSVSCCVKTARPTRASPGLRTVYGAPVVLFGDS